MWKRLPTGKRHVAAVAAALAALVIGAKTAQGVAAPTVIDQLVGSWKLISRVTTTSDGGVLVDPGLSAVPNGVLIYDRSGHVAAQLSRPGRSVDALPDECRAAEKVKGTNDTAQTILGYDAYFGTFTVDTKNGVVTHHLESALFPGDIGKDIKRNFSIAGDMLTIKFSTTTADGTAVVRTLVWARMK